MNQLPIEIFQKIYKHVYDNVINEIEEVWDESELDERPDLYDTPSCDPEVAVRVNDIRVLLSRRDGPCMCMCCSCNRLAYDDHTMFDNYEDPYDGW